MSEAKTCRLCQQPFEVRDEDLDFYTKMSPTFGEKTFPIPSPTLCPQCRTTRRLAWRNELELYKRPSSKSGKDIVSVYAPESEYTVYAIDEWWQDDWDATSYAQEYDPSKPFFEQFGILLKKVPKLSLFNTNTEDCEYVNYTAECKNSYMSAILFHNTETTHYSYWAMNSVSNTDIVLAYEAENCYLSYGLRKTYGCKYSVNLENCRDCYYSINLTGCKNCILSSNLSNKEYYVRNKEVTKEEYEQELAKLDLGSWKSFQTNYEEFLKLKSESIVRFAKQISCENVSGHELLQCKNMRDSFLCSKVEDASYLNMVENASNVYDSSGGDYEWALETNHTGMGTVVLGCSSVLYSSFMYYCVDCYSSSECFGCVGLRNKQHCIFNKQYTKDEYYQKVGEIAAAMTAAGEWGEFYPLELAPFAYNETNAQKKFPKTKEEVVAIGGRWRETGAIPEFSGEKYEPQDNISVYVENEDERNKLLAGVLQCEKTGRPYKIVPQELALYIKMNVPIPRYHYKERMDMMFTNINPFVLHHRQCVCENTAHEHHTTGRCPNEFDTTYDENRTEKVYCEVCYQKTIE